MTDINKLRQVYDRHKQVWTLSLHIQKDGEPRRLAMVGLFSSNCHWWINNPSTREGGKNQSLENIYTASGLRHHFFDGLNHWWRTDGVGICILYVLTLSTLYLFTVASSQHLWLVLLCPCTKSFTSNWCLLLFLCAPNLASTISVSLWSHNTHLKCFICYCFMLTITAFRVIYAIAAATHVGEVNQLSDTVSTTCST